MVKRLDEAARKSDEFLGVRVSRCARTWRLADMRRKGTGRVIGIEAALRELVRDVVRDELRHLREDMLDAIRAHRGPPPKDEPNPEELLTVEQVAQRLKVIPDTVRTWIQSGALRAGRPGDGTRPGRKYRVRRGDLYAFIAASERPAARPEVVAVAESEKDFGRPVSPRVLIKLLEDRPPTACPEPRPHAPACRVWGCSRDLRDARRRAGSSRRGERDRLASCRRAFAPIARRA
jgi:excisionase family DNA binding protein